MQQKIINIAVIAHVDAGKSTLVDALLSQSGAAKVDVEQVMDSNDLERERGITIYSKNCAIEHSGIKINIVDTPGHADFSSEVERIIKTVDTVILLVDSSEGPMPQTRVVLKKSLEHGLRPILLINKIDKKDQRAEEVVNMTFDLFCELGANDEQLDFPILYGMAKNGVVMRDMADEPKNLEPLFDLLFEHVNPYPDYSNDPLQLQVSSLKYDDYLGRQGVGRIFHGTISKGQQISICKRDGSVVKGKIAELFINQGLNQVKVAKAYAGDIVTFAGIADISIGETVCEVDKPNAMPTIEIEKPTLQMNFLINNSPFAGRSGKYVTSRQIKARLDKELETNIGLLVEDLADTEGFKVSGRGELHLSILLENMRREGYELSVSKPKVLFREIDGNTHEPYETVQISTPTEFASSVINQLNIRKGLMQDLVEEGTHTSLSYVVPTRGIIGYRSEFINTTRGQGTIERSFSHYDVYAGEIETRKNGVLIVKESGTTMGYSLMNLGERGTLFIGAAKEVYAGMIVGQNSRDNDLVVNPCKNKQLTNVRASGSDDATKIPPVKTFTLEEALEYIADDELVEITPDDIRLRKIHLCEKDRKRLSKGKPTIAEAGL